MWWFGAYVACVIFFLAGYVLGQGFRRYREADEHEDRDRIVFLAGFFSAYNLHLKEHHEHQHEHTRGE